MILGFEEELGATVVKKNLYLTQIAYGQRDDEAILQIRSQFAQLEEQTSLEVGFVVAQMPHGPPFTVCNLTDDITADLTTLLLVKI